MTTAKRPNAKVTCNFSPDNPGPQALRRLVAPAARHLIPISTTVPAGRTEQTSD
jgi:hypothetical protein